MRKYIAVNLVEDMDCPLPVFGNKNIGFVLKLDDNKNLPSGVSIGQEMVDNFIKEIHISTLGTKTTMVRAVLVNDFEIIETSSCVDESNYDEKIGAEVCLKKIKDKVWMLLGFLLQTATCDVSGYAMEKLIKTTMDEILGGLFTETEKEVFKKRD